MWIPNTTICQEDSKQEHILRSLVLHEDRGALRWTDLALKVASLSMPKAKPRSVYCVLCTVYCVLCVPYRIFYNGIGLCYQIP